MKYLKQFLINESSYTKWNGYDFEDDTTAWYSGQSNHTVYMYSLNGHEYLAKVDYVNYKGEISISWVESIVKGKGYGQIIMQYLASKFGYENLQRSSLTDDGAKMRGKLDKFYNFDYAAHEESKNKHLPKSVIEQIKDPVVKEFIRHMVNIGYTQAWELWKDTDDFKSLREKYDFNDISEIAEWIKGSKTNEHDPLDAPPDYIMDLLNELSVTKITESVQFVKTKEYKYLGFPEKVVYKFAVTSPLKVGFSNYNFECIFSKKYYYWVRNYGSLEKGQSILKNSNAATIINTLSEITLEFIETYKPNVLSINHLSDQKDPKTGLNRRAAANYRFLKNKIPNDYDINYYRIGDYSGADVMCVIKRKDYDYKTTGILIK